MCESKDPFRLADELCRTQSPQQGELKGRYEGGEHQWLGMRGATLACEQLGIPVESLRRLQRRAADVALTYGEIVALSGDFYPSPKELFEETPSRWSWIWEQNDLSDLRRLFTEELTWIEDEHRARSAGYPDNNLAFWWNAKSYLELAEKNEAHFGWHNVVAYCEHHACALGYAMQAREQSPDDEHWRRALYYNGFADHFLTDGFAAGHVRVPRAEISAWGASIGYGGELSGLLAKVLHDQDGHVKTAHARGESKLDEDEGLPVRNSLGVEWSTRCDGQLFLVPRGEASALIAEPVAAVAASLTEVYEAQQHKRLPAGEYRALAYVPFPHPDAPTLAQKFHELPEAQIKELLRGCRWYTKLPFVKARLDEAKIARLFAELPQLMSSFASHVRAEYAASERLQLRLPRPYVDAFSHIA